MHRHEGPPRQGLLSDDSNFGCLADSVRRYLRQKPEAKMPATPLQHRFSASEVGASHQRPDLLCHSGEASSIIVHMAASQQRRLIDWLRRCVDELPDGLADDPRDGCVSRQRDLIQGPIVLLFEAYRQPCWLARALVHATLLGLLGRTLSLVTSEFNKVMHFSSAASDQSFGPSQQTPDPRLQAGVSLSR